VLYGTAWDDQTLLAQIADANEAATRKDGVQRHFVADWQTVAAHNPAYRQFVEAERARLGEDHPLFRTQYALQPLRAKNRAFDATTLDRMRGDHGAQTAPREDAVYVAGIDMAGESEAGDDAAIRQREPWRDSTVLTIAEVAPAEGGGALRLPPVARIVAIGWWTGRSHASLLGELVALTKDRWRCRRVVVDATGVGAGVASLLATILGRSVVERFVFTVASKSALAFALLAAAENGRLRMYAGDDPAAREFWREFGAARVIARSGGQIDLRVDPADGHDDFVMSAALAVRAAETRQPREAIGRTSE
ncbi:MAG: hypothetical protein NZ518_10505, partial [Dehalococcoidia bacterium]|nr:hypothetical protein [Dehalococcoidia bacterium]